MPDSDDVGSSPFDWIVRQAFPGMFRGETTGKGSVRVDDRVRRREYLSDDYEFVKRRYNWAAGLATGLKQASSDSKTGHTFDKGFFDSRKGKRYLDDKRARSMPRRVRVGWEGPQARLPDIPSGNIVQDVRPVHTSFPARLGLCGAEQDKLDIMITQYKRAQHEALRLYKELTALQVGRRRQTGGGVLCSSYDRRIASVGEMIVARQRDIERLKTEIERLNDAGQDEIGVGQVSIDLDDDDDYTLPVRQRGGSGSTLALAGLGIVTVAMAFVAAM